MAPPVAPWMRRKSTSMGRFGARPQSREAMVKPLTETMSSRLRPKKRASQPVSGSTIALATRYDVRTHVDSSMVADRLPAMCGSDTLTTVVSSTSMNVANMTAIATIQGLTGRWVLSGTDVDQSRSSTVGVTDMPGRSRCSGSWPGSKTIFTGTRWTTFT